MATSAFNKVRRQHPKVRRDDHTVGLFVVEKKAGDGPWFVSSTRGSMRAAQDCAWEILTREGGVVRVRQGSRLVAVGARCAEHSVPRVRHRRDD